MLAKGVKRPAPSSEDGPSKTKIVKTKTDKSGVNKSKPKNLFKGKPTKPLAGKLPNAKGERKKKDEPEAKPEKTDWRKFKQDKKELKLKRKQTKGSYDVAAEAKRIYEKLKCRKSGNKSAEAEKLYELVRGEMLKKFVLAHDTARIVQTMIKCASPAIRTSISEELLPQVVEMAISKYAHFCVVTMFKYGSAGIKTKLVDSLLGNVVRLACHNISSKILDNAYLTHATPQQKIYMRQEFYGDLYKKSKDDSVKELSDTYKETKHMKAAILGSVKSNLDHVANKKLVDSSLVHAIILEYLKECEEDKIEETVTMYSSLIPLLLTTKEGCEAAVLCFWHSTPKNRRAIVKTIKEHLVKICTHEQGHVFVIAMVNALDDTKATKKAIFDPILADLQTIAANQWGRRVIEWFVSPGDTKSFHPNFTSYIEEGLKYGKKDKELRRKEIFEQIEEPIAKAIADAPEFWFADGHIGLVTANLLNKLTSTNFTNAAQSLANLICKPDWTASASEPGKEADTPETVEGIVHAGLHVVLKKIIKHDSERSKENQEETFGAILSNTITDETVKCWLTHNRGCFILLNVIENNAKEATNTLKQLIKDNIKILKGQSTAGSKLLLKKIEN
ncbi:protein penguin [Eupeodes corollae]|uniref:protein penguin n=1 Tax=Eupeodes corollae TaxID=290404 RepID=UPI00249239C2|nr:protein penguin [Eupeodes corollae]